MFLRVATEAWLNRAWCRLSLNQRFRVGVFVQRASNVLWRALMKDHLIVYLWLLFILWEKAVKFLSNREIMFDVTWPYVKLQTATMTSEFVFFSSNPPLNHIKIEKCLLLIVTNTNIFTLLFNELKTDGKSFIFAVCSLTYDHVTSNLISLMIKQIPELQRWYSAWQMARQQGPFHCFHRKSPHAREGLSGWQTNALTQFTVTTNNPGWTETLDESGQFPAQEHRAQPSLEPGPVNVETNSILVIHSFSH